VPLLSFDQALAVINIGHMLRPGGIQLLVEVAALHAVVGVRSEERPVVATWSDRRILVEEHAGDELAVVLVEAFELVWQRANYRGSGTGARNGSRVLAWRVI